MNNIFYNFEKTKLNIVSPELTNILICCLFFLIVMLCSKNRKTEEYKFLSSNQTVQLKGLAIFFVILGHLWVHVSQTRPSIVLSGDAVAMFLILSGYGLSMSSKTARLDLKIFILKRISRVMIPYWIVTVIIFILDYLILKQMLNTKDVILTLFGLNLNLQLRHLDYVRWFVTFILFWYSIFFIGQNYILKKSRRILFFLILSFILLPLSYYYFNLGWYQFFSFPVGCILGVYYKEIDNFYFSNRKMILLISIIGLLYAMLFKILINSKIWDIIVEVIPNVLLKYVFEGNSIILCLSILLLFEHCSAKGFFSNTLSMLGKYSYELILLHGAFLIKYNPIITNPDCFSVLISFYILLFLLTILSVFVSKTSLMINEKNK